MSSKQKTETQYIEAALELVENVRVKQWHDNAVEITIADPYFSTSIIVDAVELNIPKWFKQLLAAQLVDQVDALEHCEVDSRINQSVVWNFSPGNKRVAGIREFSAGEDRAMNTIMAVVDSELLK